MDCDTYDPVAENNAQLAISASTMFSITVLERGGRTGWPRLSIPYERGQDLVRAYPDGWGPVGILDYEQQPGVYQGCRHPAAGVPRRRPIEARTPIA